MWVEFTLDNEPEEGRDLYYFFEVVGVHKGKYFGSCTFASPKGFLNGDVTHWQYDTGVKPEVPDGYIQDPEWLCGYIQDPGRIHNGGVV